MTKKTFLTLIFLSLSQLIFAQLFLYEPDKWDEDYTFEKFRDDFQGTSLDTWKWHLTTNYGRSECIFLDLLE